MRPGYTLIFTFVGVGLNIRKIPGLMGTRMCGPLPLEAVVGEGAAATSVGTFVAAGAGATGAGGATMDASVLGIQFGEVTAPDIHANPLGPAGNTIYHHVPSVLFPATSAEPPWGIEPIML